MKEDRLRWQESILRDPHRAKVALRQMEETNHAEFVELCHSLLEAESLAVRDTVLTMLGALGDQNDSFAETAAIAALQEPELRSAALFALGRVGTPRSFNILYSYASSERFPERQVHFTSWDTYWALESVACQARTDEQHEKVRTLARQRMLVPVFKIREAATNALLTVSSVKAEEETLVATARRYPDPWIFEALATASPNTLPALYELLADYAPPHSATLPSAEYQDIQRTIDAIERK
jgi:HEAT repeat protein